MTRRSTSDRPADTFNPWNPIPQPRPAFTPGYSGLYPSDASPSLIRPGSVISYNDLCRLLLEIYPRMT